MTRKLFTGLGTIFFLTAGQFIYSQKQDTEIGGELKMTFPSIYFKHNSTDYASMPYSVDSCFKYIADNVKDLNSYPVWRDSSETEGLTNERIKKLKEELNKYTPSGRINFESMGNKQKISQRTIHQTTDDAQIQYLLSLNSVLDMSGAISRKEKKRRHHLVWCGWKRGFHWSD